MSARKCPLCGKTVTGNECISCGFVFPDEEKIAAPYDLDPSNDLFGEAGKEAAGGMESADETGIASSDGMDSIHIGGQAFNVPVYGQQHGQQAQGQQQVYGQQVQYKSPPVNNPVPNIKVRNNPTPPAPPVRQTPPVQQNKPIPPANSPYNLPHYPQQPPPPPPQYTPYTPQADPLTRFVKAFSEFVQKHWWQFLLMLLMPTAGIGFAAFYFLKGRLTDKAGCYVLAVAFTVISLYLKVKGVDIFGVDGELWEILMNMGNDNYYY